MTDVPHGSATRVGLRELLGGKPDPDFSLVLPPGWVRRGVDEDEQERMLAKIRTRTMQAHRPDLLARLRVMVDQAFTQMRKVSTLAMFTPADEAPESAYLPASLTASVQHAEAGQTLDSYVRAAILADGATPLLGDKRIMRMERETTDMLDGEQLRVTTIAYLTPVPGSGRRRALLMTLVLLRGADVPADDPPLLQMKALFDLCVSTLTWIPAE